MSTSRINGNEDDDDGVPVVGCDGNGQESCPTATAIRAASSLMFIRRQCIQSAKAVVTSRIRLRFDRRSTVLRVRPFYITNLFWAAALRPR